MLLESTTVPRPFLQDSIRPSLVTFGIHHHRFLHVSRRLQPTLEVMIVSAVALLLTSASLMEHNVRVDNRTRIAVRHKGVRVLRASAESGRTAPVRFDSDALVWHRKLVAFNRQWQFALFCENTFFGCKYFRTDRRLFAQRSDPSNTNRAPSPVVSPAFYVAPGGSDSNAGTAAAPFATLSHAVTTAAGSRTKVIYLRAGTYYQASSISLGSSQNGLSILGYPGETAIISGGTPVTHWTNNSGIWTATTSASAALEFSVGGIEQTPARYPVGSWNPSNPQTNWLYVQSATRSTFTFASRCGLTSSNFGAGSYVYMQYKGCSGIYTVRSVNFNTHVASMSGTFTCGGNNFGAGANFYVFNDRGDLTAAGQWFYNPATKVVSYMPSPGTRFHASSIGVTSAAHTLFRIVGASNIAIQGLNFTDFVIPSTEIAADGGSNTIPGVIDTSGPTTDLLITNNNFYNVGKGIRLNPANNTLIQSNSFNNLQAGAISVQDGSVATTITNNYINGTEHWYTPAGGIAFANAGGDNVVTHNTIYNTPRWGIDIYHYKTTVAYGNSIVGWNDLENTDIYGQDSAAIYINDFASTAYQILGRDTIQYNRSLNEQGRTANPNGAWTTSGSKVFTFCYYLDDGTSGYNVVGNACVNPAYGGLHFNGTNGAKTNNDNLNIQNNLVYAPNALSIVFDWTNGCGIGVTVTHSIGVASASGDVCGRLRNNDYYGGAAVPSGDKGSIVADPQFKNPTRLDYGLKSTSPAYRLGYQELPWSQMGVRVELLSLASSRWNSRLDHNVYFAPSGSELTLWDAPWLLGHKVYDSLDAFRREHNLDQDRSRRTLNSSAASMRIRRSPRQPRDCML